MYTRRRLNPHTGLGFVKIKACRVITCTRRSPKITCKPYSLGFSNIFLKKKFFHLSLLIFSFISSSIFSVSCVLCHLSFVICHLSCVLSCLLLFFCLVSPLPSSFANVDVSHSVLFVLGFPDVTPICVRMSDRHLLISSLSGSHRHISCTSLYSSSFPLFDSLFSDSVFARIHPCFSRQCSLNGRSDSPSAFIVMWLCRLSTRCKRCASWAPSSMSVSCNVRRQDAGSSGSSFWRSFNHNPWQWGSRSSFVSCGFLRQLQFCSHHLPRSGTQTFPVRRLPSITRVSVLSNFSLAQLRFLVMHKTAPVRS